MLLQYLQSVKRAKATFFKLVSDLIQHLHVLFQVFQPLQHGRLKKLVKLPCASTSGAENFRNQSNFFHSDFFGLSQCLQYAFLYSCGKGLRQNTLFMIAMQEVAELFAAEGGKKCLDTRHYCLKERFRTPLGENESLAYFS
jgi:hypothetical protein